MTEKQHKYIYLFFKYSLPIMSFAALFQLLEFLGIHMLYFPDKIELALYKKQYFLLTYSILFFILSKYYKFKLSLIFSSLSIFLALINFLLPEILMYLVFNI